MCRPESLLLRNVTFRPSFGRVTRKPPCLWVAKSSGRDFLEISVVQLLLSFFLRDERLKCARVREHFLPGAGVYG